MKCVKFFDSLWRRQSVFSLCTRLYPCAPSESAGMRFHKKSHFREEPWL